MLRTLLLLSVCLGALTSSPAQTEQSDARATQLKIEAQDAVQNYIPIIQAWANQTGVDQALIVAVIKVESDGDPNSQSPAGAMGLMQLMPATCEQFAVANPFDPEQNIRAGSTLLAQHLARYGNDLKKTLAAYNAGPGRVDRDQWMGIPETRHYVQRVLEYYNALRGDALGTGIGDLAAHTPNLPTAPPLPTGPFINSLDMMFQIVQSSISGSQPEGVAEDGTLDDVADTLLSMCLVKNTRFETVAARAPSLVAKAHFAAKDVHAFCFTSSDAAGFAAAWGKVPGVPGRFVGLAHASTGSDQVWVVLIASRKE